MLFEPFYQKFSINSKIFSKEINSFNYSLSNFIDVNFVEFLDHLNKIDFSKYDDGQKCIDILMFMIQ